MNDYTASGNWKTLSLGAFTAIVSKHSDFPTVTLKATSLRKEASWDVSNSVLKRKALGEHFLSYLGLEMKPTLINTSRSEVHGTLYFKDIDTLNDQDSKVVNYDNDRLVFYPDALTSTDFTAYVRHPSTNVYPDSN